MSEQNKQRIHRYDLVTPMQPVKDQIMADFGTSISNAEPFWASEQTIKLVLEKK